MTPTRTSTPTAIVDERPLRFTTTDNVALNGVWFVPSNAERAPLSAIVIACGAGIPARFYYRLARYLANAGAAVLTFDYRGIGASREGDLRKLKAGMDAWAALDFGAALAQAHATYPHVPLGAIAHSIGTLYVGAAPDAARLSRLVFLGPHTGYWRDYARKWRWLMYLTWHVFMPAVTKMAGYFPGRAFRLGEDLPAQAALDWAGRRKPALTWAPDYAHRFGPALARYGETRARTLALSISDDAFAPPDAARRLLSNYPALSVVHETITPANLGCRRLGHLGFLRRPAGEFFWRRAAAWLIPQDDVAPALARTRPSDNASTPANRAAFPNDSSMRSASFHFAIRSDRANDPTLS
jgi:predicted alpha/beta hydrolase